MEGCIKENKGIMILALVDFVLITASGIYFGCKVWQMIPLWVSLVVMIMQTKVNRYAFILGGCNSIWYAAVYFSQELYASAAYVLFFSATLQFVCFWNWSRHAYKNSAYLKKMSLKHRILLGAGLLFAWILMLGIFAGMESPYMLLDNTVSLLGICVTFLQVFAFIEGYIINVAACVLNVLLYIQLITDSPDQMPYLVSAVYTAVCVVISVKNAMKLYEVQQESKF